MESLRTLKVNIVLVSFILMCSSMSWGSMIELFYDDFDDGNYNGWSATDRTGAPATAPDIVSSPEGFSLRGVGSGYSNDPGLNVWLSQPLVISNVGELKIEMRAISGPQWPNTIQVYLCDGDDFYRGFDYGEGNKLARFDSYIDGTEVVNTYSIGDRAYEWHDFAWTRDIDGWWSLSIDGVVEDPDFYQNNELTSFDRVALHILRNQSEVE